MLLLFKSPRLRSTEALRVRVCVCACTTDHPVQSFKPELRFKPNIEFSIRRKCCPSGYCRVHSAPAEEEAAACSLYALLRGGRGGDGWVVVLWTDCHPANNNNASGDDNNKNNGRAEFRASGH